MSEISIVARMINGLPRNVDLSANTLVVQGLKIGSNTLTSSELATLMGGSSDASSLHNHDGSYFTESELGSTANGSSGASLIGVDQDPAFTNISGADVQAIIESIDSALGTAGGNDFADNVFRISDNTTSSKKIAFEASGISESTVRTITMPDANIDLGDISTNASNISTNAGDIDDLEAALGSATGLAGMDYTSTNYVTVDTTAVAAISALDSQVKTNADAISSLSSATYFKGAATAFADLNPASVGDYFVVTSAFSTVNVGDHLIAKVAISEDPTDLSDFAIVDNTEASDILRTSALGVTVAQQSAMTAAEGDIDDLEAALGSATGLAGMDYTSTNYVTVDTTAVAAISALDAQVKTNADAIGGKQAASANLDEADTFFGSTDISASEAETLTDGSNADSLHYHAKSEQLFTAGEEFAANSSFWVRWAINGETAGRVYKADKAAGAAGSETNTIYVIGLAQNRTGSAIAAGSSIPVVKLGLAVLQSSDSAFTASQDEGLPVYLGASGAYTLDDSGFSSNDATVWCGNVSNVGGLSTIDVKSAQIMGVKE